MDVDSGTSAQDADGSLRLSAEDVEGLFAAAMEEASKALKARYSGLLKGQVQRREVEQTITDAMDTSGSLWKKRKGEMDTQSSASTTLALADGAVNPPSNHASAPGTVPAESTETSDDI